MVTVTFTAAEAAELVELLNYSHNRFSLPAQHRMESARIRLLQAQNTPEVNAIIARQLDPTL